MARLWLSEEEASLYILWSKKLKMISNFEAGQVDPSIFFSRKCTILACADHGIAAHGVSAFDDSVTLQMIKNYLIHRGAAANVFSKFAGADLFVVDVGVRAETKNIPDLIRKKISHGTKDFSKEPAMSETQAIQSIEIGRSIAKNLIDQGYRIFLPAEMGIGNTTSSAAITSAICKIPPEVVTGRGSNISDNRLQTKIQLVNQALEINQPNPDDGIDVLKKVGGFELGCLAGVMIEVAKRKSLTILDGFNTFAAALIAEKISPESKKAMIASQISREPGQKFANEILKLNPFLDLHLRFGECSGSSIVAKMFGDRKIEKIPEIPFDESQAKFRIDHFAKPIDSLGIYEEIAIRLAGKKNIDDLLQTIDSDLRHEIILASVKMLLEMKTFEECGVSTAIDGIGKSRQSN